MTVDVAQQVTSCGELSVGDQIEAWHNGKLFHRGEIIRTVAATDLFWILDERTGTRRLIDAEVLVIRRVAVPGARNGSDAHAVQRRAVPRHGPERPVRPAGGPRQPARPASHVPLFQAPSLAG